MASKIPKRPGQQKFDDFDDVFSSMEALNEATKFNNLNKGHDFFPELANKQKLAQGFKSVNDDPAQFRGRKVQSVQESKNFKMPNFNDLYHQIEQISGVKITPEEEEERAPLYQRKSPDHQLSSSKSHKPKPPPPGFEKLKISEDKKHEPELSPQNPPPQAAPVSKFEPVTENVNEVANNIFFERFGVPITGIQSSQESSEEVWDCSISTT